MGLTSQQIKNLAVGCLVWLYKQGQLGNGLYLYGVLGWLLAVAVFFIGWLGWLWFGLFVIVKHSQHTTVLLATFWGAVVGDGAGFAIAYSVKTVWGDVVALD